MSAYVAQAIRERAEREQDVAAMEERWGPFPPEAVAWARGALGLDEDGDAARRQTP